MKFNLKAFLIGFVLTFALSETPLFASILSEPQDLRSNTAGPLFEQGKGLDIKSK